MAKVVTVIFKDGYSDKPIRTEEWEFDEFDPLDMGDLTQIKVVKGDQELIDAGTVKNLKDFMTRVVGPRNTYKFDEKPSRLASILRDARRWNEAARPVEKSVIESGQIVKTDPDLREEGEQVSKISLEVKGSTTEQAEALIAVMEVLKQHPVGWEMTAFNYPLNKELVDLRPDLWHHIRSGTGGAKAWTNA